jgi:uncharacterized membrane protein YvbJ
MGKGPHIDVMADFDVCSACGQKVIKGAMRCMRCGQALITLEEQIARVENLKKREKDGSTLSLVGLLVLVLAAGIAYLLFSSLRLEIISALFTN